MREGSPWCLSQKVTKAYWALSCVPRWKLDAFVTLSKRSQVLILYDEDLWQQIFDLPRSLPLKQAFLPEHKAQDREAADQNNRKEKVNGSDPYAPKQDEGVVDFVNGYF